MTSDATPGTPVDPRDLLNAAIDHAPKTALAGPLADLVVKEMRNGLWWLDKTEAIRPGGDLPEIAFDAVYADKARAVLALPVADEGSLRSQASGTPAETGEAT